jgi:predicted metal-dependent hydrolase
MEEELQAGIFLWNGGQYVEAHEAFEDLWMGEVGPRRHFLRGLVHAAMGFHYATVQDADSARSKLASAADLLDGFPGDFLGLDVNGLRAGVSAVRMALEPPGGPAMADSILAAIPRLAPAPVGAGAGETDR